MYIEKRILDAAKDYLERSIVYYQEKAIGTAAAIDAGEKDLNYDQIFTRDFFVSAIAFLLNDRADIVKNFLKETAKLQHIEKSMDCFKAGQGLMPASFKKNVTIDGEQLIADFGEKAIGRVTPIDSSLWWLVMLRVYKKFTEDKEFVSEPIIQNAVKAILDLYLVGHFELIPTILVPDGSFMIDRRMGIYGHPLDIEVLFFSALRSAIELLEVHETDENKKYIKDINHRLEHLVFHLRTYYWLDQRRLNNIYRFETEEFGEDSMNKYNIYAASIPDWVYQWIPPDGGYFVGNIGPGRIDFRFLSSGNLLSILSDLTNKDQSNMLMTLIEERWDELIGNMPIKICYPALEGEQWRLITGADPKNIPWSYHNGASWPFLIWMLAAVCIKTGREDLAIKAVKLAAGRLPEDGWPEYYDGKSNNLIGKEARSLQVWTIAGFIAAHAIIENPDKVSALSFDIEPNAAVCKIKV